MKKLEIHFGAMAKSVSQQIKEQTGLGIFEFDIIAESLTRIYLFGILSDNEISKVRKRLMVKITSYIKEKKCITEKTD